MNVFSKFAVDEEELEEKKPILKFIENSKFQLMILVVTIYALFADQYKLIVCRTQLDSFFDVFVIICIALFSFEIIIATIFKQGYFNSYYFYLDIVSTASLILDFTPVKVALLEWR